MIDARHLVSALTENQEDVGPMIQALQLRGWRPAGSDSVKRTNENGAEIQVWVYVDRGLFHAYGQAGQQFPYDSRAGERSQPGELDLDEIVQKRGEEYTDFADRINDEFGSPEIPEPDPAPDAVGADYGYHKAHPMDRF